jgi:hypothetical protein
MNSEAPVAHTCNPSNSGGRDLKDHQANIHETLSQKFPTQKRTDRVTPVVDLLASKCKALSSNSSTAKQNKILKNELL